MIMSLLVAADEKNGIGKDGKLPWHLGADLKLFKRLTMGHHILMGRKTYESIGHPLPGRETLILTRSRDYTVPGATIVASLDEGIQIAEDRGEIELFVIGGGQVFAQALPLADRIYLTRVHTNSESQVFFPELKREDWVEVEGSDHLADVENDFGFHFSRLEKSPVNRP